jgi:hypothetical protein
VTDDGVDDLQPAVDLLDQIAAAVDHLEDVDTFLMRPDLVGQLAAAPVRVFSMVPFMRDTMPAI